MWHRVFNSACKKQAIMTTNSTTQFINQGVSEWGQAMVYRQLDNHSCQALGIKRDWLLMKRGISTLP